MNKKHITHGKLKVFMILFLAVILIVLVVVCAKKIKLSQNEKNIICVIERFILIASRPIVFRIISTIWH